MITLSAITREGVTFLEDMFASRAESISGGAKLFTSLRLFKWDTLLNFSVQFLAVGNNSSIILDGEVDVPAHQSDSNWSHSAPGTGKFFIRPQPVSPERSVSCQGRITLSLRHSVSKNCVPFLGSHCPILTKIGKWLRLSSNKKDQVSFWT